MDEDAPTAELITVTPQMAREWLKHNKHNRRVRKNVVLSYARDMQQGKWLYAADPIRFDTDDALIDGQHRLLAVALSEVPVMMLVVTGLDPATQEILDAGIKRTAGDALHLRGVKEARVVAGAAAIQLSIDRGYGRVQAALLTHADVLEWYETHPAVEDRASLSKAWARSMFMPPSVVCLAWYQMGEVEPTDAGDFWHSIRYSQTDGPNDPRYALLRRLQRSFRDNETYDRMVYLSIVYRSWNMWRRGASVKSLNFSSRNGLINEIPKLK